MADELNQDPSLKAWLDGLKKDVEERKAHSSSQGGGSSERQVRLPIINMGNKFYQGKNRTYPEMQGSIQVLPVPFNGSRVTELNRVFKLWCPSDEQWSSGFTYHLLPDHFYPEGEVRSKVAELRSKLNAMMKSGEVSWKKCGIKNFTLILGLVISHRNTKKDIVASNLYGGDELIQHVNVPALIVCPNAKVQSAIQDDLDLKTNAIPYAMACYSNAPIKERKGWMAIKFTDSATNKGYDVSVTTEIANPITMPDGILPPDFNEEDERVKLLYTTDPIKRFLDYRQVGEGDGVYYNETTLKLLEQFINSAHING